MAPYWAIIVKYTLLFIPISVFFSRPIQWDFAFFSFICLIIFCSNRLTFSTLPTYTSCVCEPAAIIHLNKHLLNWIKTRRKSNRFGTETKPIKIGNICHLNASPLCRIFSSIFLGTVGTWFFCQQLEQLRHIDSIQYLPVNVM